EVKRRDHLTIAGRADYEVDVSGAVAVALLRANHVADRAIHWDHVAGGSDAAEVETAAGIRIKAAAQIHFGGVELLQVVPAFFIGLPDLNGGVGNALAGGVLDTAVNHGVRGLAFAHDRSTQR